MAGGLQTRKLNPELEYESGVGYHLDARQNLFWENYATPGSLTFNNAYQSALKAGYTHESALRITMAKWFRARIRRLNMLNEAEKVLKEMVKMPVKRSRIIAAGTDEEEEVIETDSQLVKIKQDTAKFLAERIGKNVGYAPRSEITGPGGAPIKIKDEQLERTNDLLERFLGRKSIQSLNDGNGGTD